MTLEGRVVEVRDGSKRMSRTYTYGYRVLRILVGVDYYSVLISTSRLNEFGFLPKVGHWIRVKGVLSKNQNDLYDPSLSRVSSLEHIEPPSKKQKTHKKTVKKSQTLSLKVILDALSETPIEFNELYSQLNIEEAKEVRYLRNTLKKLRRKGWADITPKGWKLTK